MAPLRKPSRTDAKSKSKSKKKLSKSKLKLKSKYKVLTSRILRTRPLHLSKKMKKYKSNRGVIYFGHVPHGFYEREMKQFFSQFGRVTNINIPKSKRTGKFKGYAFVEFEFLEVAKVVAETMNNYLMFKKVMKAKLIEPSKQKPYCFRLPSSAIPLLVRRRKYLRGASNRPLTEEEVQKETKTLQKSLANKLEKLKARGIDYTFQVRQSST